MTDSERIEILERENELLKDKIDLLEELQRLREEKRTLEYKPLTAPWIHPYDPWPPTVTWTSSSDDTIRTIYANEKTGDA